MTETLPNFDLDFSDITEKFMNFLPKLGKEIIYLQQNNLEVMIKKDGSKVTNADLYAEEQIRNFILPFNYSIISEESENSPLGDEPTWLVDPIDGTSSFVNQKDSYAIMVGLAEKKKTLWAMIYLPARRIGYYAIKDQGCFRFEVDDQDTLTTVEPVHFSHHSITDKILVMNRLDKPLKKWEEDLIDYFGITKIDSMGSIGVKLAQIAEGHAHYYFNLSSRFGIWDLSAPILILEEAGGMAVNAQGKPVEFESGKFIYPDGLLASQKKLLEEGLPVLLDKIKAHR